jgi:hypothetical protein
VNEVQGIRKHDKAKANEVQSSQYIDTDRNHIQIHQERDASCHLLVHQQLLQSENGREITKQEQSNNKKK